MQVPTACLTSQPIIHVSVTFNDDKFASKSLVWCPFMLNCFGWIWHEGPVDS